MSSVYTWKIGGEAGYGIMSIGLMFAKSCLRAGFNVFSYSEYPSLIRGGHNTYAVSIAKEEVSAIYQEIDCLVALNQETIERHFSEFKKGGTLLYDSELIKMGIDISNSLQKKKVKIYSIPFLRLAKKAGGKEVMQNTVALGSSLALLKIDFSILESVIGDVFKGKGREVVAINLETAKAGYDYIKVQSPKSKVQSFGIGKRILLTGNEAMALGALSAGLKFFVAYPMTPATSILHLLAAKQREQNLVTIQVEDEISVINMAIGVSYAGVRSMTATSGGGFSLMVEALGMAAMTEVPLVVIEAQRPGPSTGMPTWTEQGDLKFLLSASQGEFARVIIAPGDSEECFYETKRAFNLAEKYQLPVLILSDKYLSESAQSFLEFDLKKVTVERGRILSEKELAQIKEYKRYKLVKDGISPRALPGQKNGVHLANSDEHDEFGFTSEESENRIKMMNKRWSKFRQLSQEIPEPIVYGDKDALITFVAWGSVKGPILEAMKIIKERGVKTNLLHYIYLSPFRREKLDKILRSKRKVVLVENNKTGQLGSLIREVTGYEIKNKLLKYDGRPFWPEEIVGNIKN